MGHAVAQLAEALRYKSEGRGVRFPMMSLEFFIDNPPGRTMALGLTQPLTEISKGKVIPLQAWSGPEGCRKLRFPDFMTTAQDGGKVVSLTHRPPLPPRKCSWYSFLLGPRWHSG